MLCRKVRHGGVGANVARKIEDTQRTEALQTRSILPREGGYRKDGQLQAIITSVHYYFKEAIALLRSPRSIPYARSLQK
jgi:hypothetical protein